MSIRTIIVDDEPLARASIRLLLEKDKEIDLVLECRNGLEAVGFLKNQEADLLFLDIQMPGMNGFEVLENIPPGKMPVIIFATAFDAFALKAFEVNAVDYILKPYSDERFFQALAKAKTFLDQQHKQGLELQIAGLLNYHRKKQGYRKRLAVKGKDKIFILDVDEIDWLQASGNYVEVSNSQKIFLINDNLRDLEIQLDPNEFVRIHRSVIINVRRVRTLEPHFNGEYYITLEDGKRFKLSRNYRDKADFIMKGLP